jgi:hypothetical protein
MQYVRFFKGYIDFYANLVGLKSSIPTQFTKKSTKPTLIIVGRDLSRPTRQNPHLL